MAVYMVLTVMLHCDTCKKYLGKLDFDAAIARELTDHTKVTCPECEIKRDSTPDQTSIGEDK
jgi:hypothetical protein